MSPEEQLRLGMLEYAREQEAQAPFVLRFFRWQGLGVVKLLGPAAAPRDEEPRQCVRHYDRTGVRSPGYDTVPESELALTAPYQTYPEAWEALDRAGEFWVENHTSSRIINLKAKLQALEHQQEYKWGTFVRNGCEPLGKDACEVCRGECGGVPGNENIIDGKVMCDYCHARKIENRYTMAQLDEALKAVLGEQRFQVKVTESYGNRPHAILDAAQVAWFTRRPDDEHTRVLRAAQRDLELHAAFQPYDGVWPEV